MRISLAQCAVLAAAFAAASGFAFAQTLTVTPNPAMADDAFAVRATGLQPGEHVTIQANLTDGAGQHWASQAEFVADAQGNIDTSTQAPTGGSYKEVSGPGLLWSMRPTDKGVAMYQTPRGMFVQPIDFQLSRKDAPALTATLGQVRRAEGVRQIRVQGQLHGWLFLPAGTDRHAAVLVVGGSDGGAPVEKAAWLASHGYAAFALAYFRYEDLPRDLEAIPLEYFGGALSWMAQRPEIDPERIAVMGTSRGGELALQLGSMYSAIKAVVAYVPANVRYPACCGGTDVPYAWTWHGQPLAFASPRRTSPDEMIRAEIAVEDTKGPILMIGAEDDAVWESSRMVEEAAARLKHEHFPYAVEVLKYPHAGHRAGLPEIIPAWHGEVTHPVSGAAMNFGGTPEGDARSSLDAIPKVLAFLQASLPSTVTSGSATK